MRHMRKRHPDLLDRTLAEEKAEMEAREKIEPIMSVLPTIPQGTRVLTEEKLEESIKELLSLLVDEPTLKSFGWPDTAVDELLESVIKRCGHAPVDHNDYAYHDRLRENSKLLFTVVIDDAAVKTLLNNQTVDEVILHVLRLARAP